MLPAGAALEPDADEDAGAELDPELAPLGAAEEAADVEPAGAALEPAGAAVLEPAAAAVVEPAAAGELDELVELAEEPLEELHAAIVVASATAVAAPNRRRILVLEVISGHSFR